MREISYGSGRARDFVRSYEMSKMFVLGDAYGRWSDAKERAYRRCKEMMRDEGGSFFKILSAGSFYFSCGWMTDRGMRVETAGNSYLIKCNE